MTRRRQLSGEEQALWVGFARSVKPLRKRKQPVKPVVPGIESASASVPQADVRANVRRGESALPLMPMDRRLKQRVARGREPIHARIDLHGLTQREAYAALYDFLQRAQIDGVRIALIVTGKGIRKGDHGHTGERGVLKRQVPMWLALPEFRPLVVGFEDAHAGHGGQGALYVRLRRAR
jgi:DNA-nicking Smr family endonuclease